MTLVLDADVLIGALDASDPHYDQARMMFVAWERQGVPRLISVVNLSEVLIAPAASEDRLRLARRAIAALRVVAHRPGPQIAVAAARYRRRHPISLADAYCVATAGHAGASVVSFDRKVILAARSEGVSVAER